MPYLYVQIRKESMANPPLVEHYIVKIRSKDELYDFCFDKGYAEKTLGVKISTLLTFSPIYDEPLANGTFREDTEFLEEEVYSGVLTSNISEWLLELARKTHSLLPGNFGSQVLSIESNSEPIDNIGHFLGKLRMQKAISSAPVPALTRDNPRILPEEAYLFRELYLKVPAKQNPEIMLYELLISHIGQSHEHARDKALEYGEIQAEIDKKYTGKGEKVFFVGIESFIRLPRVTFLPMKIATQLKAWPWEYDLENFKKQLIAEILRVNSEREKHGCFPFWQ